jgi:hypothetical protein
LAICALANDLGKSVAVIRLLLGFPLGSMARFQSVMAYPINQNDRNGHSKHASKLLLITVHLLGDRPEQEQSKGSA